MMQKKMVSLLVAMLWMMHFSVEANAISDSGIIYIQEDGLQAAVEMLASMIPYVWKDIVAVCAAFLCTVGMTFFAIKQRNRGK